MSGPGDKDASAPRSEKPCPICGKPQVEKYRPFCSKRCADVDLNRWLSGAYAIPVTEEEDEDGDPPEPKR
ncbi:DNA gyrase inhibitor YacG [Xanthobacter sediminis]